MLLQKSLGGYGTKFNTHFLVRHLLLAPKKKRKQEAESSHRTLSCCCMLPVLSEEPRWGRWGFRSVCGGVCVRAACREAAPGWV